MQFYDSFSMGVYTIWVHNDMPAGEVVAEKPFTITITALVDGVKLAQQVWAECEHPTMASAVSDEFFDFLLKEVRYFAKAQLRRMADAFALEDQTDA